MYSHTSAKTTKTYPSHAREHLYHGIMFEKRCFKWPAASAVASAGSGDVGGTSSGFCTGFLKLIRGASTYAIAQTWRSLRSGYE